jgi:hypothetical protein
MVRASHYLNHRYTRVSVDRTKPLSRPHETGLKHKRRTVPLTNKGGDHAAIHPERDLPTAREERLGWRAIGELTNV